MAEDNPNRSHSHSSLSHSAAGTPGIPDGASGVPGSTSSAHPRDAIPTPEHGFAALDLPERDLTSVPAAEVVSRAAVLLMAAAAEKLGLTPGEEPDIDLVEARRLIQALAGLLAAALPDLGPHTDPLRSGLTTLQTAFREASAYPDEPGKGPGESLLS